tara:strand:+ start:395 stop:568 length:174 start_codon:yes stop_codon:yes gene_type:complete
MKYDILKIKGFCNLLIINNKQGAWTRKFDLLISDISADIKKPRLKAGFLILFAGRFY